MIHAAKASVDVLVMGLEPVAKCGSQHARGSAWRAALHDEVFAIKKVSGIARVKRKGLEPRKRCEYSGCPLPPIAQHIVHAEKTLAVGKGINRCRIPMAEVKITEARKGRFLAPRIEMFASIGAAVGGAVPLRFSRQCLPCPPRICHGLRMTHINGPIRRQRNFFEHRAVEPSVARLAPEYGMRNGMLRLPFRGLVAPERAIFIAAGSHEIEVLTVRHLVAVNRKRRYFDPVSLVLVVPTECLACAC